MYIALYVTLTKKSVPNITIPEPYKRNRISVLLHFLLALHVSNSNHILSPSSYSSSQREEVLSVTGIIINMTQSLTRNGTQVNCGFELTEDLHLVGLEPQYSGFIYKSVRTCCKVDFSYFQKIYSRT
jgi:hypothetical protein